MRFGLMDLLFAIICLAVGAVCGQWLAVDGPGYVRRAAGLFGGLGVYLALICPFYRLLKLPPMMLPRCPCCARARRQLEILDGRWPRIRFRCPNCGGEFIVWHNGRPGAEETWTAPVLALRWPYAFGRYVPAQPPAPSAADA